MSNKCSHALSVFERHSLGYITTDEAAILLHHSVNACEKKAYSLGLYSFIFGFGVGALFIICWVFSIGIIEKIP